MANENTRRPEALAYTERMGLLRFLLMCVGLYVVLRALWRVLAPPAAPAPSPTHGGEVYEPMAPCAKCRTHVPRSSLDRRGWCGRCQST